MFGHAGCSVSSESGLGDGYGTVILGQAVPPGSIRESEGHEVGLGKEDFMLNDLMIRGLERGMVGMGLCNDSRL